MYILTYTYSYTYVHTYIQPAEIPIACQHATRVQVAQTFNARQTSWSAEKYHKPEHPSCAINRAYINTWSTYVS